MIIASEIEDEPAAEDAEVEATPNAKAKLRDEVFLLTGNNASIRETIHGDKTEFKFDRADIRTDLKRERHLVLGFDTEYQSLEEFYTNEQVRSRLAKYEVLSYQFFAINHTGAEWSGIAIPDDKQRISFTDFIVYAISRGVAAGEEIPRTIVLVGHYNRADVPAFDDTKQIFPRLKNVRNSLVSLGAPVKVRVAFSEDQEDYVDINVYVRDTMLLAPSGRKSLAELGRLIGVEKMKLADTVEEDCALKKMMKLVREDWDLFRAYAIIDAEICARYYKRLSDTVTALTGGFAPTALSSIGMKLLINEWENRTPPVDALTMTGREKIEEQVYDEKRHTFRKLKLEPFIQELHWSIDFATECYHGGRNEQLWFGPSPEDDWTDYDLSGAYPTAMATIGRPKWSEAQVVQSLDEIGPTDLGFVCVDFEFPGNTRYPTLPVRSQNGIIFPLSGRSCCAMPEIELARQLDCELTLRHGVRIPQDLNDKIFFPFVQQSIRSRLDAETDLERAFWKEATNSCYGKTAQGLRDKRVFSLRKRRSERVVPSAITNPFLAAHITSFVRAVVGEIMNRIPESRIVFSVTTDGFITNASAQEMERAKAGPIARKFGQARRDLTGGDDTLAEKHAVRQLLGWRTRGQATLKHGDASKKGPIVLARAGIKPPIWSPEVSEQNDYIIETFLNRTPDSKIEFQVHTSIRETILWDADLVSKKLPRRISMEFDYKRKPHAAAMMSGDVPSLDRKFDHIAFSTKPWGSLAEFNRVRRFWDDHWNTNPRCIKSLADFRDFVLFLDMVASLDSKDAAYLRKSRTADLSRLQRDLCRAFKSGMAGLAAYKSMRASEFAKVINECGLEAAGVVTSQATVENGKRVPFKPHTTPRSARVVVAVQKLAEMLPEFDSSVLLARPAAGYELSSVLVAPCPVIDAIRAARPVNDGYVDGAAESAASVNLY
jgi:hypothetical protein